MWLRSVGFTSLCSEILLFSLPFVSEAQSSEAAPSPDKQIIGASSAESDFRAGMIGSFEVSPGLLPDGYSAGTDKVRDGLEAQQQSRAEAHIELMPLFARWREDMAEHRAANQPAKFNSEEGSEHYHWKGLLWQSLAFIGAEDVYRFSTDYYARHLTATGPYWRNYGISMRHWDMNRWSDGDDFLVDDIGHPMQGAVSEYLWIQNSPSERNLRIGDSGYWKSRFYGLLWSTAYSTQQKIGPLGEAAIGNAGGYTYPLHCPYPCTNPHVKYTNNTGWTDFIMTPAGGFVWVVGEDLIDRYISDRVQGDSDRLFPKIVRGTLNPTRTAANLLRGKNPWYRDYLHPAVDGGGKVHFERGDEEVIRHLPRYEIFPHFNAISLTVNTETCIQCRKWTEGAGVGFSARLSRWVDFDSDVNYQPNVSPLPTNRAGGDALMGTFGFRSGIATPNYALKLSIRPGFVSYNRAYVALPSSSDPVPNVGRVTHFAAALAINGDYDVGRHLAIRGVFGNTPVRYLKYISTPPGIGSPPYVNWLSHEFFSTNENWTFQAGPVLRF